MPMAGWQAYELSDTRRGRSGSMYCPEFRGERDAMERWREVLAAVGVMMFMTMFALGVGIVSTPACNI